MNGTVLLREELPAWREALRDSGKTLAVTNGCFDILHPGHAFCFETARRHGDALLVGVNGDESVRRLKGPARPINTAEDRARMVAALAAVDAVSIFPEVRAVEFLKIARPDVYVKGGDYTLETLNPEERQAVENAGGRIVFVPFLPGKSTSALIEKIARL